MLKFFLIGWACVYSGTQEQCVRMGSEVIHETIESCEQHYEVILEEISKVKDVEIKLTCVSSGVIEDYILQF
jgi:transposase-like protein|tara:strand:+ start:1018 stop:1233 length:216 start_codon:yes stop_codon:yes gene_type:complete